MSAPARFAALVASVVASVLALDGNGAEAQALAATPPMGWNSWDAYGFTIDENDFKANAAVLAGMKSLGWTYAVIDEGWYMKNPAGANLQARDYQLDAHGLLEPVVERFASSAGGAGLKPLAQWVHAQGLKFGLHIVRGVPKGAVRARLPIADSVFTAADAADTADTCPWDDGNFGVRDNAAGQAYYDSMLRLYADWGLDYLKVDCIANHPYKAAEIRQISLAIRKSGRPIVLSLSPGPTQLSHAREVGLYAQMWRISNDIWDGWAFPYAHPDDDFPNGVAGAFDNLAKWNSYAGPGRWPDADMLPFGSLTPHPGWGEPRQSRLTPDEERTQFTLWAIARSPLILGGNLTRVDEFTRALITNAALIAVNQESRSSHPVTNLPAGFEKVRAWIASRDEQGGTPEFLALFNLDDKPVTLRAAWGQLGIAGARHGARELLDGRGLPEAESLQVSLPAHGSVIYSIR